jgi:ribonuclease P protein component
LALPQRHRLKGQRVFDALYRRGQSVHGTAMVLRWMPHDPALLGADTSPGVPPITPGVAPTSPWRCGVVISNKVHKRAVRRNRLRRQLHEALRRELPQQACAEGPGPWLLISLKPGSADWELDRLLGECRHLLGKAGLTS